MDWRGGALEVGPHILLPRVPINLHILRRASRRDDVQLPIAVEIREHEVFAGHRVVINEVADGRWEQTRKFFVQRHPRGIYAV